MSNSKEEVKANSIDMIRKLMRDQKRNCESLRFNSLFSEFSQNAAPANTSKHNDEVFSPIKDIEGEARFRTSEVVQEASLALEKEPKGVWATLGKPYVCLGPPIEVVINSQTAVLGTSALYWLDQNFRLSKKINVSKTKVLFVRRFKWSVVFLLRKGRKTEVSDHLLQTATTISQTDPIVARAVMLKKQKQNVDAHFPRLLIMKFNRLPDPYEELGDLENNAFLSDFTSQWIQDLEQTRRNANLALQKSIFDRKNSQAAVLESVLITKCCFQMIMDSVKHQSYTKSAPLNSNIPPVDTWTKTLLSQDHLKTQLTSKSLKLGTLPATDAEALERFYLNICRLVYTLSKGDPDLLFIVHTVKELLENGFSLTRVFLARIVQETVKFMMNCGRAEYNAKLLPILSFISRCTSTGNAELNQMLAATGMLKLVYSQHELNGFGSGLQKIAQYGRSTLDLF
eukprot:g4709.t1